LTRVRGAWPLPPVKEIVVAAFLNKYFLFNSIQLEVESVREDVFATKRHERARGG
jgi:hypothetical protein